MLDVQKELTRAANALEQIECLLIAIEMMQAAQDDGSYDDGSYEESLHIHLRFEHADCAACGTKARH